MHRRRTFSGFLIALLAVSTPAFGHTAEPDTLKVVCRDAYPGFVPTRDVRAEMI
jgi:hypothetical protein